MQNFVFTTAKLWLIFAIFLNNNNYTVWPMSNFQVLEKYNILEIKKWFAILHDFNELGQKYKFPTFMKNYYFC